MDGMHGVWVHLGGVVSGGIIVVGEVIIDILWIAVVGDMTGIEWTILIIIEISIVVPPLEPALTPSHHLSLNV